MARVPSRIGESLKYKLFHNASLIQEKNEWFYFSVKFTPLAVGTYTCEVTFKDGTKLKSPPYITLVNPDPCADDNFCIYYTRADCYDTEKAAINVNTLTTTCPTLCGVCPWRKRTWRSASCWVGQRRSESRWHAASSWVAVGRACGGSAQGFSARARGPARVRTRRRVLAATPVAADASCAVVCRRGGGRAAKRNN